MAEDLRTETLEQFESSGQKKAAEEAGVDKIINIRTEKDLIKMPIRDHRSDIDSLPVPRFLVEADHIVNLPIFKPHQSLFSTRGRSLSTRTCLLVYRGQREYFV
jgi:uncharacterized protein (DUF362 family)